MESYLLQLRFAFEPEILLNLLNLAWYILEQRHLAQLNGLNLSLSLLFWAIPCIFIRRNLILLLTVLLKICSVGSLALHAYFREQVLCFFLDLKSFNFLLVKKIIGVPFQFLGRIAIFWFVHRKVQMVFNNFQRTKLSYDDIFSFSFIMYALNRGGLFDRE